MKRLFLIRHAEPVTAWGADDPDPGLSERGHAQAQAAADALLGLRPKLVVSSPMKRCRETAAPLATALGVEALIDASVSEVVAPAGVTDRRAWLQQNFVWSVGAVRKRWTDVDPALRTWRDSVLTGLRALPADAAVFSHFIAINAILSAALESQETIVHRPNHASITEIAIDGDAIRLVKLGEEMHDGDVR